ncbi:MAG: aminopeptidase P family N-terminal domain-containing protein, partial [Gammaproteobacteria bacterium]|nr:aminopeptidase P family N-terminal domain-containing protein [Gammaproteobacteria bacterium]
MINGSSLITARQTQGMLLDDTNSQVDMVRMRGYRLQRVQQQLRERDYGAAVLYDPINIRYASGSRNMAVWTSHAPARYLLVPVEGRCILFDYFNSEHLAEGLETIVEIRSARGWYFFVGGTRSEERSEQWAGALVDALTELVGDNRRVAFDRLDPFGLRAMEKRKYSILDGQEICEMARAV